MGRLHSHPRAQTSEFGKPDSVSTNSWEEFGDGAIRERSVMVSEFHHWLVKTRIDVEQKLLNARRSMNDTAFFAEAGIAGASTPKEVPLCVIDFARDALRVIDLQRKLDLLNVYYRQAANEESDDSLTIEKGNEAEVGALWNWFIECRSQKG
ncbi:hypothetical protein EON83_00040 [bacterium]|nr:MAG: hypothetical protein EON83_00040 [bacterium]